MYLLLAHSTLLWFGRALFQCGICVERYLAVVQPLTFIRFKPLRFRVVCSGLMRDFQILKLAEKALQPGGNNIIPAPQNTPQRITRQHFATRAADLLRSGPVSETWMDKRWQDEWKDANTNLHAFVATNTTWTYSPAEGMDSAQPPPNRLGENPVLPENARIKPLRHLPMRGYPDGLTHNQRVPDLWRPTWP
ncbi:unnamed protein product [Boreogadus saida]